jgi:hypothetical protein
MIVEAAIVGGVGGLGIAAYKVVKAMARNHDKQFWRMGSASHLDQPHLGQVNHLHGPGNPEPAKKFLGLFG